MNWISAVFFILSFMIFCTTLRKDADALSPARVFGFTWSIVFALANLKLSKLQLDWTIAQWIQLLLGPVCFIVGLFVAYVLHIGSRLHPLREIREMMKNEKIHETRLFRVTLFAFVTYVIGFVGVALAKGQIPLFALNPSAARTEFMVFGIAMFIANMTVILFLSLVYLLFTHSNNIRKKILSIAAGMTFISYLLLLQRYQIIMAIVMMFTLLYYGSRAIRPMSVLLFLAFGVLLFYFIATLRAGQIIQYALYKTSLMKFSSRYAIFTEPYMYIVMNVENLANSISKLVQYSFGYFTFDWFFALIQLKYPMREYFGLIDNPYTIAGYNSYTIFWTFYRDFGIFGITFVPFVGGLVIGLVYYTLRRSPSVALASAYSVAVFLMVLSFFVNPLGFLWFIYIIGWIVFALKYIRVPCAPKQFRQI